MKSNLRSKGIIILTALACLAGTTTSFAQPAAEKATPVTTIPAPPAFKPADGQPAGAAQTPSGPAALRFERTHVSVDASEGETVDIEYPVENTSDQALTITVRPSCGCTAAAGNPTSLKPHEKNKISVQFNSTGRVGKNHKSVTVETNDPNHSNYQLTFEANITSDVYLSEGNINFGSVSQGKELTRTISLFDSGEKPIKIISVKAEDPRIKVKQEDAKPFEKDGKKGFQYDFVISIPADTPQSNINSRVTIESDYKKVPFQYVIVNAEIFGDVAFVPNRIFSQLVGDTVSTKTLTLTSRSGRPFEVKEVVQFVPPPMQTPGQETQPKPEPIKPFATALKDGRKKGDKEVNFILDSKGRDKTVNGRVKVVVEYTDTKEKAVVELPILVVINRTANPLGHGIQVKDYKAKPEDVEATKNLPIGRPSATPLATLAIPPVKPAATPASTSEAGGVKQ